MIVRKLNRKVYRTLQKTLTEKAFMQPIDPGYIVELHISGTTYTVKMQPAGKSQIAVLYAHRVNRVQGGKGGELIVDKAVLTALLEILLYQRIR